MLPLLDLFPCDLGPYDTLFSTPVAPSPTGPITIFGQNVTIFGRYFSIFGLYYPPSPAGWQSTAARLGPDPRFSRASRVGVRPGGS